MPVLSYDVWAFIGVAAAATVGLVSSGIAYVRTMNRLDALIRQKYFNKLSPSVSVLNQPALGNDVVTLDRLVLGFRWLDIQEDDYKRLLFAARIQIAICAVAFLGGLIALAVLFQIPASCCTWGAFAR